MIVEDEEWIRSAMVKMIEDELGSAYKVVAEAENGEEALNLIYDVWPTVIITDIKMPQKDGLWLVKEIFNRQLPVASIIVSGYEEFEYAQKAMRYGVLDYLLKPVVPEDLLNAIKGTYNKLMLNQNMHKHMIKIQNLDILDTDKNNTDFFKRILQLLDEIWYSKNMTRGEKIVLVKIVSGKIQSFILAHDNNFKTLKIVDYSIENIKYHFNCLQELWLQNSSTLFNNDTHYIIEDICKYIQLNHAKDITLTEVSNQFHYSISYFCLLFKKHTGFSFTNYLNLIRMKKAKELLVDYDYKVYEVAEMVGFQTLPYFNRVFKQTFGCSPNEYRRGTNL